MGLLPSEIDLRRTHHAELNSKTDLHVYASLCRFLERLLLVHGTLADYRLSRLIKYSFYKNIAFATTLFFFQARISSRPSEDMTLKSEAVVDGDHTDAALISKGCSLFLIP